MCDNIIDDSPLVFWAHDGSINFKEVVETLAKNNYEGWFIVEAEQDPAKANPLEYAKIGNKELVECLKMYGYDIEGYKDE